MIGTLLAALFQGLVTALLKPFTKKSDQDTGREFQRGDDGAALAKEAQAINSARSDPAIADVVRKQSYRD